MKKVYIGIISDKPTPKIMDKNISGVNVSCDNSCPPLNPIANKRYIDMNLEEFGGISKSLLNTTAIIPSIKKVKQG